MNFSRVSFTVLYYFCSSSAKKTLSFSVNFDLFLHLLYKASICFSFLSFDAFNQSFLRSKSKDQRGKTYSLKICIYNIRDFKTNSSVTSCIKNKPLFVHINIFSSSIINHTLIPIKSRIL